MHTDLELLRSNGMLKGLSGISASNCVRFAPPTLRRSPACLCLHVGKQPKYTPGDACGK